MLVKLSYMLANHEKASQSYAIASQSLQEASQPQRIASHSKQQAIQPKKDKKHIKLERR